MTPFACSCLGVYSHFPWSVVSLYLFMITARSVCIETITLLLEELNHDHSFSLLAFSQPFDSLTRRRRVTATCRLVNTLGGVGCEAGGRERGRAVKCYRNSWLKRGNGRYWTSSIDTDRVGARLNRSSSRLDYGPCSHPCCLNVEKQPPYMVKMWRLYGGQRDADMVYLNYDIKGDF